MYKIYEKKKLTIVIPEIIGKGNSIIHEFIGYHLVLSFCEHFLFVINE